MSSTVENGGTSGSLSLQADGGGGMAGAGLVGGTRALLDVVVSGGVSSSSAAAAAAAATAVPALPRLFGETTSGGRGLTEARSRRKKSRSKAMDRSITVTELPDDGTLPDGSRRRSRAMPIDEGRLKRTVAKIQELAKIMAPHLGLNLLLLSYIALGGAIFQYLEADVERTTRLAKVAAVGELKQKIIDAAASLSGRDSDEVNARLRPSLNELSWAHEFDERLTPEKQMWTESKEKVQTKWSLPTSILFALTVITCTGYDFVNPATDAGRMFTLLYGLVGIPLMFITAADVGKFLSMFVVAAYAGWVSTIDRIRQIFLNLRRSLRRRSSLSTGSLQSHEVSRRTRSRGTGTNPDGDDEDEDDEDDEDDLDVDEEGLRRQLPIASYFVLILGYCCLGSLLLNVFEKAPVWSFTTGVFFSFNVITTIVLGNIRVTENYYLAIIVFYIIVGLAVITASLDLCSSTLKRAFTQLHYFGRKIQGARRGLAYMGEDLREAMRILAALKKTRPANVRVTLQELRRFLEEQDEYCQRAYVPYNIALFKWIEEAYATYLEEAPPLQPAAYRKFTQ